MRNITLASDSDSEKGMIVDPPPDIIDRFQRMRENPEEKCAVPPSSDTEGVRLKGKKISM